jgi:hypothetical protein
MTRRSFVATATAGGMAFTMSMQAADTKRAILELRQFKMRNTQDAMRDRTSEFLGKSLLPALKRVNPGPVGLFTVGIGQDAPYALMLTSYPDLSHWESAYEKVAADKEFLKARESYYGGGLGYVRMETTLLRAFPTIPGIEAPPKTEQARVFEIRTYESNSLATLQRKIHMFDESEIAIFRKNHMLPVFFGETIVGRNMPNLTYMLAFDDLAAREKAWKAFGGDPDWKKLRTTPGLTDGEIVSNISNSILQPLAQSDIR